MKTRNFWIHPYAKFVLLALCLLLANGTVKAQVSSEDKAILIDIYKSTNGSSWVDSWDITTPVTDWYGVSVKDDKVVGINLFRNNLSGSLPTSIGGLKNLEELNLSFNRISGAIPSQISQLSNLRILKLEMNALNGSLPKNMKNLKALEEFTAFNNLLSGTLPKEIGLSLIHI